MPTGCGRRGRGSVRRKRRIGDRRERRRQPHVASDFADGSTAAKARPGRSRRPRAAPRPPAGWQFAPRPSSGTPPPPKVDVAAESHRATRRSLQLAGSPLRSQSSSRVRSSVSAQSGLHRPSASRLSGVLATHAVGRSSRRNASPSAAFRSAGMLRYSASLVSSSLTYANGSASCSRALWITVSHDAIALPPSALPANSQFFRPSAGLRVQRSHPRRAAGSRRRSRGRPAEGGAARFP
mgnify:CR=1 FL=1